jgi:hypothetical protein
MAKHFVFILLILTVAFVGSLAQDVKEQWPSILEKELAKFKHRTDNKDHFMLYPTPACHSLTGRFYINTDAISSQTIKYLYIGRVSTCRSGGCKETTYTNEPNAYEYFEYFMLFDSTGIVKKVKVFNYQATHGHEITAPSWLKQFIGYKGHAPLLPGKQIDAIAGATISVHAISDDIKKIAGCLVQTLKE